MTMWYKTFAGDDLDCVTGAYGHGQYRLSSLPTTCPEISGEPVLCRWGYHVCRREHVIFHLSTHIAAVEIEGVVYRDDDDKGASCAPLTVVRLLDRWTPQVQRLFGCDVAARVAHLAGEHEPTCHAAILAARRYALGLCSDDDLAAAAEAARVAACELVAAEATEATEATAGVGEAADAAAWAAGRGAARAARAAARAARAAALAAALAARRNETAWQSKLLWQWLDGHRTPDDVRRELEELEE